MHTILFFPIKCTLSNVQEILNDISVFDCFSVKLLIYMYTIIIPFALINNNVYVTCFSSCGVKQ